MIYLKKFTRFPTFASRHRLLLALCALFLLSCSDDEGEECIYHERVYVTSVEAPSEAKVGETVEMRVSFQVMNGCGGFGKFIESGVGLTRTVEVEARYEGCICTQDVPIREASYTFIPGNAGEYVFRFKSRQDEFITVVVAAE